MSEPLHEVTKADVHEAALRRLIEQQVAAALSHLERAVAYDVLGRSWSSVQAAKVEVERTLALLMSPKTPLREAMDHQIELGQRDMAARLLRSGFHVVDAEGDQ